MNEAPCYIQVAVDGMWRVCPQAGGSIQFAGFNGQYLLFCLFHIEDKFPIDG